MRIIRQWLTNREGSARKDILLLFAMFGVSFFLLLGRFPLVEPDETRYAEIPREMLERCDFITPFLNYVKYFEKPPLHYWVNALSMSLFGQNEFAARFPGTLMGLLTVVLTYHAGRKLFDRRTGLLSAIILGTSVGFFAQARLNITDMTLTCTLSAALAFFIVAARDDEPHKGLYYHLAYVSAALAVLAKGLIGIVFPGAIVFLFLLLTRRWRLLKEMRLATGIPLFLAVAAPWFVLASMKNPEFARFFFIHEHFERFTSKVHGRYQPLWYFVPVLAGTMIPWSLFIPAGLRNSWRERATGGGRTRLYLAIWAVFIFLFFSKSNSKLIPYLLPLCPALALLMGNRISTILDGDFKPLGIPAYLTGGILCLVGAGIIILPHMAVHSPVTPAGGVALGVLFLAGGICALGAARRRSALALFAALATFSFILELSGPGLILPGVSEWKSSKEMSLLAARTVPKDAMLASFGLEQGLSYYTKRRIVVVGPPNELEFGSKQGDNSAWFLTLPQFTRIWTGGTPVYLLISDMELSYVRNIIKPPYTVLGRSMRKLLITNQ
jgi:4-amino-4-deoxy-L-arabinose transferase-like glycosyltransferase